MHESSNSLGTSERHFTWRGKGVILAGNAYYALLIENNTFFGNNERFLGKTHLN